MDSIGYDLLDLGRQTFLECLRNLGVSCGVRHLACVLVAVGVMCCIRDFVLYALGYLCHRSIKVKYGQQ